MSPYEMSAYREDFDRALARLGWRSVEVEKHHERDDCSWPETVLVGPGGEYLMSEYRLTEGMVREIIRIAGLLPGTDGAAR
jgi:hypothetical protein